MDLAVAPPRKGAPAAMWGGPAGGAWAAPAPSGKGKGAGKKGQSAIADSDDGKADLVEQVKSMQRADAAARVIWADYVAKHGENRKDPNGHTSEFLQSFLVQYTSGALSTPSGGTPSHIAQADSSSVSMPDCTKFLQKSSKAFRTAWAQYCASFGGGTNDPMRHEQTFHIQFFDSLARSAVGGEGMSAPSLPSAGVARMASMAMAMTGLVPPAKRMRIEGGIAAGQPTEPMKDQLVQAVKAYQRAGEAGKQEWAAYTDQYLGGVRDPARHDIDSLQQFCDSFGLTVGGAGSGVHFGAGPGMVAMRRPVPTSTPVAGPAAAPLGADDPQRMHLVSAIKAYQKSGEEQKAAWADYCGPTRDPARHPLEKLQEFCNLYGLV